jgi:adenosine deaminase
MEPNGRTGYNSSNYSLTWYSFKEPRRGKEPFFTSSVLAFSFLGKNIKSLWAGRFQKGFNPRQMPNFFSTSVWRGGLPCSNGINHKPIPALIEGNSSKLLIVNNRKLTQEYLKNICDTAPLLESFCQGIPGVELHIHADGALWAERIWEFLKKKNFYLTLNPFLFHPEFREGSLSMDKWANEHYFTLFRSMVTLKGALPNASTEMAPNGDFVGFFGKFKVIEDIRQHMSTDEQLLPVFRDWYQMGGVYQELMIELPTPKVNPDFIKQLPSIEELKGSSKEKLDEVFKKAEEELNEWIKAYVKTYNDEISKADEIIRGKLKEELKKELEEGENLEEPITSPKSPLHTKFIIQIMRTQNIATFVAECLGAAALLKEFPKKFVGINIVGPEHTEEAKVAYRVQQKLFSYLYSRAPSDSKPKFTLHAGELSATATTHDVMRDRIRNTALKPYAGRIGHACCLGSDKDPEELLSRIRHIEVCLSSNKHTLGMGTKKTHPFPLILSSGVPFTICTDDPGPLRTNKKIEFMFAIKEFDMNWEQIVRSLRDGLEFSFLDGISIWKNSSKEGERYQELHPPFSNLYEPHWNPSLEVQEILNLSEKAVVQIRLEKKLMAFEAIHAEKYHSMRNKEMVKKPSLYKE